MTAWSHTNGSTPFFIAIDIYLPWELFYFADDKVMVNLLDSSQEMKTLIFLAFFTKLVTNFRPEVHLLYFLLTIAPPYRHVLSLNLHLPLTLN